MDPEFTGRKRYRVQPATWLKPALVVLQLEQKVTATTDLGGYIDVETRHVWVDARPEHVLIKPQP
jgi:hypothetical protein